MVRVPTSLVSRWWGVLVAALLACAFLPGLAWAESAAFDGAVDQVAQRDELTGNSFFLGSDLTDETVARDLYWAGLSLEATNVTVGSGALVAGKELTLEDSCVGGSLRMAGDHVRIAGVAIQDNLTVLGAQVIVGEATTVRAVYATGALVNLGGTCDGAIVVATRATLSGHVRGDVTINSKNITIEEGAVVEGTLTIPEGAGIFAPEGGEADLSRMGHVVKVADVTEEAETPGGIPVRVALVLFACIAYALMTLFVCVVLRRYVKNAVYVWNDRPGPCALLGFWTFLSMPFVAFVLIAFIVTIPLTALIAALLMLAAAVCLPVTSAVAGAWVAQRRCAGKHAKKLALAFSLGLTLVACAIPPYSFVAVHVVCSVFFAGCISQVWLQYRNNRLAAEGHPGTGWLGGPFGGGIGGTGGFYDEVAQRVRERGREALAEQRARDREREARRKRDDR